MVIVIASIQIKAGKVQEFLEILKDNVPKVLDEAGCIEYAPTVDIDSGLPVQQMDEKVVTIIEKWQSLEALKAHLGTPHMLDYREKVKNLVEDVSLKVLQQA